jgi:hypothetical protein
VYLSNKLLSHQCDLPQYSYHQVLVSLKMAEARPGQPIQRSIVQAMFGGMLEHDLQELIPSPPAFPFFSLTRA